MVRFVASRVITASVSAIWEIVSEPARFPEWFDGVESALASGELGRGQTHVVAGPWGDQRFEIERLVEHWEPPRLVRWRDTAERLDGVPPTDMWHSGSWLSVALARVAEGTQVTVEGRQVPATEEWRERLLASVPMIEARLASSLECLARLVEPEA
jgi:uncharacterized protein YndB with AHSA1/START domain